jgi:hypothetical protein
MTPSSPKARGLAPKLAVAAAALLAFAAVAYAELTPWKDYAISEAVWYVTTIKVEPNMQDVYLEGLKNGWAASMETSKKLGQVEEYRIFTSSTPASGDFNMILVAKFKNAATMAPNKERFDAFMKAVGEAAEKQRAEHAQKAYPSIRKITGDYMMREITLK